MFTPSPKLIAATAAGTLALAGVGEAVASAAARTAKPSADQPAKVGILERPDDRFDRTIVVSHHRTAYARARKAGVAPKDNLAEGRAVSGDRLVRATSRLRSAVHEHASSPPTTGDSVAGSPESLGVSLATLDAIASCESGGDPTAVSPDGTYRGKYQFDEATWASVGGSGDPAAAPVAEQDMRAAMLYSEVGASAWPVCGQ